MKRGREAEPQDNEDTVESPSLKKSKKRKKDAGRKREATETLVVDANGEEEEEEGSGATGPVSIKKEKKKERRKKKRGEGEEAGVTAADGAQKKSKEASDADNMLTEESMEGRAYTVSIALPGSIVENAQTRELKTYLAGQIARAAVVFSIDEIIIFDEHGKSSSSVGVQEKGSDPNVFLARLLEYQETPQYLRKTLFPMHPDLKFAGLLNPLDCPHHMRVDDVCPYREGVVCEPAVKDGPKKKRRGPLVDCGMKQKVVIDKELEIGTRVTVKLDTEQGGGNFARGEVVAPSVPRAEGGIYWGYTVRLANTFSAVFTHGPHKGGYDLTIGTSERGESVDKLTSLPAFKHLLVVFGGLKGLEYSLECDETLVIGGDVSLLFHHYLNTCLAQGSRTIRTEEAVLISLAALRPLICKNTLP